jgi:predicted oxidoreductase
MGLLEAGTPPKRPTREDRERGVTTCAAAYDAGYRLFDTADAYGRGACEEILGDALREVSGLREDAVIATKCGTRQADDPAPGGLYRFDLSSEHIVMSCEGSLKRLGIETIDLYQLHRPDFLCDPHEVGAAFDGLKQQGKVRYFGVSNFLPSQVAMLQRWLNVDIVANQVEIHPLRLNCLEDGTLDLCFEKEMTPLAWSPLAGGVLGEGFTIDANNSQRTKLARLHEKLDRIGGEHGVSRSAICLAWLLKHPSGIVPIVGSTKPDRIRDAASAEDVELTRLQWYEIYVAAWGGERLH